MSLIALTALLAAAAPGPRLGLASNIPGGIPTEAAFFGVIRDQIRLGVDGLAASAKWSDLEPSPGRFEMKPIRDSAGTAKLYGAEVALTLQTLDTNQRTLPADLAQEPWGSAKMRERFSALVRAALEAGQGTVRWLSLGNEVDGYLSGRPAEIEGYLAFLAAGREAARAQSPDVLVGVTTMFNNNRDDLSLVRRLNQGMGATFFTYYPLLADFKVRPVAGVAGDFAAMATAIPDRPVILQEVGYPASTELGSSEGMQADFIRAVFRALERSPDRFAFASFFIQYDFSPEQMKQLTAYYGLDARPFVEFLGSLGMRKSDGTPRAAWGALREEMAKRPER